MPNPLIGRCPICDEDLEVTRLHCPSCDTALEGHFSVGRFARLTPEQLYFAETFLRCEGKITRVEEELGISYPTVRSRLADLIRALGFEESVEAPLPAEERRLILEQLAAGAISSEEAVKRLKVRS